MLRQLWKNLCKKSAPRNAARRGWRTLALEALEDRCVPTAEYFWTGPSGGMWSNPANWASTMPGTVPTPGSYVVYNSFNTSVDDLNIPSPGLLTLVLGPQAGMLNIENSLQQGPGSFVVQEGGIVQVSGSLTNGGYYNQFAGAVNITGGLQNTGQYDLFGGFLVGSGTFLNSSTGQAALLAVYPLSSNSVTIGVNLQNYNNIDWLAGNIDLENTLTNNAGGLITIATPGTLSGVNGSLVNNSGAFIEANITSGAATIKVPLGANNTNYGTISAVKGGLELGLNTLYTNEGTIAASVTNSASFVTIDGPYQQLVNTQTGSTTPITASFAGDFLTIKGDVTLDAGTLGILGQLGAGGSAFTNSLTVNPGAKALFKGTESLAGSLSDSGVVQMAGGNLFLGLFGQFDINTTGTLLVDPASSQSIIAGDVYNAGTVTANPGAQLAVESALYSQTPTGVTNLNGTAAPGGSVLFQAMSMIDETGGVFNVSNATVDSQGYTVEVGATLNFGPGSNISTFNGDVTIDGTMNFTDGNNVTVNFNNNLNLGTASSGFTSVVSLYLTDVINVTGTTTFGSVVFDFLNVPPTPPTTPYQNLTFGTVVGAPLVELPLGWTWMFVAGGVMQVG